MSYSDDWHGEANDGDEEYEVPDGNESEDSVDEIPKPRKKRSVKTSPAPPVATKGNEVGWYFPGKLLKLGDPSADGAGSQLRKDLRVGMKAWIVGRNAMTWQHPLCFCKQMTCAYDSSGRSKCKLTGEKFDKGELKLGTRSHTASNWYKASAFSSIVRLILPALEATTLQAKDIDGYDNMDPTQQKALSSALEGISKTKELKRTRTKASKAKNQVKEKINTADQPPAGSISRASGPVEWRWAAMVCSGNLIPSRETASHCYARTHKGNVKTLAKGKSYWWMKP